MEDSVSIRRDVLLRQRKYVGQLSGRHLHDIEKIFADPQDISLTYGRGDRKTAVIDDPVALCGIHDEDCIQVIRHLLLIYLPCLHRGVHKRHRFMWNRRCIRADMRGDENVPLKEIAFCLHSQKFCSYCECCQCTVAVRDKSCLVRSRAKSSETSEDPDRSRTSAFRLSVLPGDQDPHHVRVTVRSRQWICLRLAHRVDGFQILYHFAAGR